MILFHKGHEFLGPNGKGYRLTRDVRAGEMAKPGDLEPFGGAKKAEPGSKIPAWLARQINGEKP